MNRNIIIAIVALVLIICGGITFMLLRGMRTITPQDLGVVSTREDYDSYMKRTDSRVLDYDQAPEELKGQSDSLLFAEPKEYSMSFSNSEISGRINYSTWSEMPVRNVQVKFSEGNVIEATGSLVKENLLGFSNRFGNAGYSNAQVEQGIDIITTFTEDPNFYIKAVATVDDNQLTLDTQELNIAGFNLPTGVANGVLIIATESIMSQVNGLDAKSVRLSDNSLMFEGTAPSVIYDR